MLDLLTDPTAWASFLTLTVLEVVLGVDNVIFLTITAARLPKEQRRRARLIGLSGALLMRIGLLFSIVWIAGLTAPVFLLGDFAVSWRDIILGAGGAFLIYKASTEIFLEMEPAEDAAQKPQAGFKAVILQIMVLDLVFSLDSVITAVGIAHHVEVMIAAVLVAVVIMMLASEPIGKFVEDHPSTKMLALAFLLMIGMALMADALHFHIERAFIYAAMGFAALVEVLNLLRARRRRNS